MGADKGEEDRKIGGRDEESTVESEDAFVGLVGGVEDAGKAGHLGEKIGFEWLFLELRPHTHGPPGHDDSQTPRLWRTLWVDIENRAPTPERRRRAADFQGPKAGGITPARDDHAACANGSCLLSGSGSEIRTASTFVWATTVPTPPRVV